MAHASAPFGVANTYATLEELKQRLAISSATNTYDEMLWRILHLASRIADRRCGRRFFVATNTKRFDIRDIAGFQVNDLIAVTQLAEDRDGDGVYEALRPPDGYTLYPLDAEPDAAHGEPYRRIMCTKDNATDGFTFGKSKVKVTGQWGYRNHWLKSGAIVRSGTAISAADKSFFVDDDAPLAAGQTIMLNSEQMFVRQVAANAIGVTRGVNGTLADAHAAASAVKVIVHPAEVSEATLIIAADRWLKRDGFKGGATETSRDLNEAMTEVDDLLNPYMRLGY